MSGPNYFLNNFEINQDLPNFMIAFVYLVLIIALCVKYNIGQVGASGLGENMISFNDIFHNFLAYLGCYLGNLFIYSFLG